MSIHGRNWRSAKWEAVVFQYTVDTGDQPNGRLFYVSTKYTLEIGQMGGCCMSIQIIHWRSAEREDVVCHCKLFNGDQPNGRMLYVNTKYKLEISRTGGC